MARLYQYRSDKPGLFEGSEIYVISDNEGDAMQKVISHVADHIEEEISRRGFSSLLEAYPEEKDFLREKTELLTHLAADLPARLFEVPAGAVFRPNS